MTVFKLSFVRMLLTALAVWSFSALAHGADDYSETIKMFKGSPLVKEFFGNSYGYAVFPTIAKGGVIVHPLH
jgi:hypothetical protein